MGWFPDIVWLMGELVLLLSLSSIVGLGVGWWVWGRRDDQELEIARQERDQFQKQRDRLHFQLTTIESLVGDAEVKTTPKNRMGPDPNQG